MTLRNRGEPSGFSKISGPVMAAAMRRANREDRATLNQTAQAAFLCLEAEVSRRRSLLLWRAW